MDRPNFLVIGANRCGTTSLYHLLAQNPDICMSRPKETRFYTTRPGAGVQAYWRDHWPHWAGQALAGEATPSYLTLPFVAPLVATDLPQAKLLAIVRNPVDRAYSVWWMYHSRRLDDLDFPGAVQANLQRLASGPGFDGPDGFQQWRAAKGPLERREAIEARMYLDGGYYADNLQRWLRHYPRDRLKVCFLEDLQRDPRTFLADVLAFLGTTPTGRETPESHHRAVGPNVRRTHSVVRRLGLARLLRKLPLGLRRRAKVAIAGGGGPPPMDPATRAFLVEHFRPHNRRLEALTGRDLSPWDA